MADNLSRREFLTEDGGKEIMRTLKGLKKVFFKPIVESEEQAQKRLSAADDVLLDYLINRPHLYGNIKDNRKRK